MKVLYLVPPGASPDHPTSWGVHMREIIAGLRRCGCTVRTLQGPAVPDKALCRPIPTDGKRGQPPVAERRVETCVGDIQGERKPGFPSPLTREGQGGGGIGCAGLRRLLLRVRRVLRGAAKDARRLAVSHTLARQGMRLIREERPDVIYERADFLWLTGWLLARWSGVPRVIETNGLYTDARGHGWRHVSERLARCAQRMKTASADRIITVSHALKADLVGIGVPAEKIAVHHNGVPERARQVDRRAVSALRDRLGLRGSTVCGFVGYFLPSHGVDMLIRAAAAVSRSAEVKVLVVGASHIMAQLAGLARDLGFGPNVIFVGPVPPDEVPVYLACMDICTIPRHGRRNSPLKLFEYGMAGKPIAAATTAGILEVWEPGVHGTGIRNGNVEDLAEAIRTYIADPGLRERHGRAFQRKVLAEHTWTKVAEWTAAVLRDVVAARRTEG